MTRLFIRFYVGIVIVLLLASMLQYYMVYFGSNEQNRQTYRDIHFGGIRLAGAQMDAATPEETVSTYQLIKKDYDFPVEIIELANPKFRTLRPRLGLGDPQFYEGQTIAISFNNNRQALLFGPLPQYVGPSQGKLLLGSAAILSLTALAIAFLLRPVVRQLRSVEKTALLIAGGDLTARIEGKDKAASVPISSAFNSMADRTESLLKSQRELLQAVSHELRTPLARIRFATELADITDDEAKRKSRLKSIDNATEQLDGLVGELLNYVRLESETEVHAFANVRLAELISDVISKRGPLFPIIQFESECASTLTVLANRNGLRSAIGNLVSNAGRHANANVTIQGFKLGPHIVIRVDDDGPGIGEKDIEKVFKPFVRLDNKEKGSGLGLALVDRIVKKHNGFVSVSRSPMGGARFEIKVPAMQEV